MIFDEEIKHTISIEYNNITKYVRYINGINIKTLNYLKKYIIS